jgi:protein-disulfide isomerase
MKTEQIPFLLLLVALGGPSAISQTGCQPLSDSDKSRLAAYVQKKYKAPITLPIAVTEVSLVPGTCYRKLQFKSEDAARHFQVDLTASPDAPVTLTLFPDFQCPYCAQMAASLAKDILPSQGDKVRLEFRYFPLAMHQWARPGAEAAACAQEQSVKYFWAMHDYFFEHQRELNPGNLRQRLLEYAKGLADFDSARFEKCLDERRTAARVEEDIALGKEIGVNATPTLFVSGERVTGARTEQIRMLIEQMSRPEELAPPAAAPAPPGK